MATILVLYGTGEGQTAKVADRITDEITARGHETTTVNVSEIGLDLDLDDFDAVLVGASIHMGRQQKAVRKFVSANRDGLVTKPTGFFQVSGSSGEETEKGDAEALGYLDEFIEATNWRPDRIGLFGGALRFSAYGFLMRALFKWMTKKKHPELETSRDVEFTDWDEVEAFANEFATFLEERLGITTPTADDQAGLE
ncbi:flavodoxin domain-containing protein [Natrialbaceae archaeon A-CW3]